MSAQSLLPSLSFLSGEKTHDTLPGNGIVLVTDHVDSPASFLLVRAAVLVLKRPKVQSSSQKTRCVFITFTQDVEHWKTIMDKQNVNCAKAIEQRNLVFLDLLSWWRKDVALSTPDNLLGECYRLLQQELANGDIGDTLVLIDDLAHLEWVGIEEHQLINFLRAFRSLLHKTRGSLIALYHTLSTESPISNPHRYLLETCTAHIGCRPLSSGRSGAVSGEMYVRSGPEAWPGEVIVPPQRIMHYRCTDTGAVVSERGTSIILS